ncbi:baseplate J/gp47 family protein [Clostridium chromiireducens]|uniref:Baseplate J/gp47 family protein n=1 Tax=Clostridium chromiireducens TaxID=225345 RepID=A0A399IMZ3_9CLOT|nr:baseplate J/gp47 family protein [Clostridium chromiireducens]RII34301.1 baseplate J/gp47 family protein [Clostridium chromiireducens]
MVRTLDEIILEMLNELRTKGIDITDFNSSPVIYSIVETAAHQVQIAEYRAADIVRQYFIEDSVDKELDKRLKERGLPERYEGSKAVGSIILGKNSAYILNAVVFKDTVFKTLDGTIQLVVTKDTDITAGSTSIKVPVKCNSIGKNGNLVPFTGLTYSGVAISEVEWIKVDELGLFGGNERESDDEVKARLLYDIQNPAGSGNKNHYIKWAKEVSGVGKVLCIPEWKGIGTGTVKVVVTDTNTDPASDELIAKAQKYIDPVHRMGEGMAPVGAEVTVTTVDMYKTNLSYALTIRTGYIKDEVKANIRKNINEYYKTLTLEDLKTGYVDIRYNYIGNIIFSTDGVDDYSNLFINGQNKNVAVPVTSLAIVGDMVE